MVEFTTFNGSKDGSIHETKITKSLGPNEVLVRITHSGLCGTDVHYRGVDMALGHEGAGIAEEVGSAVDPAVVKQGDRVGWGYLHDSCGHCKQCLTGLETFCAERHMYGDHELDQGSMGSHAIWKADYLFKVPDSIENLYAAPLMCGGATVFNAMQLHGVKSTDRVGVIGVGGLGHLAIQFAAAMGCEVVVLSGTESKKEEAIKLGAKEFYATKGKKELDIGRPLDHLLVTASAQPDWNMYMPIMAPRATIYPLSVSEGNLELPYMPVLLNGLKVQGSLVAARQMHRDMLEFAAYHNIKPITQTFPMTVEGIEDAFETLNSGKMRYRGVLVAQ